MPQWATSLLPFLEDQSSTRSAFNAGRLNALQRASFAGLIVLSWREWAHLSSSSCRLCITCIERVSALHNHSNPLTEYPSFRTIQDEMDSFICKAISKTHLCGGYDSGERQGVQNLQARHCAPSLRSSTHLLIYREGVEIKCNFVTEGITAGNQQLLWHGTARECKVGDPGNETPCTSASCSLCNIIRFSFDTNRFGSKSGRWVSRRSCC